MRATKPPLGTWVQDNLWAVLAAAFALYGGYLTGMTTMGARVTDLEKRVHELEEPAHQRRVFNVCTTRNLDKVFDKLGVPPACPMEVPE